MAADGTVRLNYAKLISDKKESGVGTFLRLS